MDMGRVLTCIASSALPGYLNSGHLCYYRWICHHYLAMAMAFISLTWEIEKEPDCAQKQKRDRALAQVLPRFSLVNEEDVVMVLEDREFVSPDCLDNAATVPRVSDQHQLP
ncbi:hypothetical protein LOK49_LG08G02246 [Camellia lanceoleosa]|uniref:Uncharacterized protein n=1 Tax=Camellia lanceoleosa TaxID=1840588 RepID=A0ACC0GUQ4_9ERIC|nr:hypothetical protein LOK49_LG08G02246 [Camellia lanceoleosa]